MTLNITQNAFNYMDPFIQSVLGSYETRTIELDYRDSAKDVDEKKHIVLTRTVRELDHLAGAQNIPTSQNLTLLHLDTRGTNWNNIVEDAIALISSAPYNGLIDWHANYPINGKPTDIDISIQIKKAI